MRGQDHPKGVRFGFVALEPVNLRLSTEARQALEQWASAEGVTLTSIVEAVGLLLLEGWQPQPVVIGRARRVAAERRSRRPPPHD